MVLLDSSGKYSRIADAERVAQVVWITTRRQPRITSADAGGAAVPDSATR